MKIPAGSCARTVHKEESISGAWKVSSTTTCDPFMILILDIVADCPIRLSSFGCTPKTALMPLEDIELLDVDLQSVGVDELFGYKPGWGMPAPDDIGAITALMS